jgi:mono/diheme cytochrome c family protein
MPAIGLFAKDPSMSGLPSVRTTFFGLNAPLAGAVLALLRVSLLLSAVLLPALQPVAVVAAEAAAPAVSYHRQIRPILQANCQGCHQPAKPEGGYVMTDIARMAKPGDSGSPGIVPGKPDESHLIAQITPDASGQSEMPKSGKPLAAAAFATTKAADPPIETGGTAMATVTGTALDDTITPTFVSDGVTEVVSSDELLDAWWTFGGSPARAARAIIDAVGRRNGRDDATALVVDVLALETASDDESTHDGRTDFLRNAP